MGQLFVFPWTHPREGGGGMVLATFYAQKLSKQNENAATRMLWNF
jgi:hypothetical protein